MIQKKTLIPFRAQNTPFFPLLNVVQPIISSLVPNSKHFCLQSNTLFSFQHEKLKCQMRCIPNAEESTGI